MREKQNSIPVIAFLLLSALIFSLPRAHAFTSVCDFSKLQQEVNPDYCFTDFAGNKKLIRDDMGFYIRDYSITVSGDSPEAAEQGAKDSLSEWLDHYRRPDAFPGNWKDRPKIQKEMDIDGVGKAYEFIGTDEQQDGSGVLDKLDNPEEGVYRQYAGEVGFLYGQCAINFHGGTTLFDRDINQAFSRNHNLQWYRNSSNNLRYKIINSHPMSDHDDIIKLEEFYVNFAKELAGRFTKQCGVEEGRKISIPPTSAAPEVEALIEKTPTDQDIPAPSKAADEPEDWGEATVIRMTGGADLLLPDGSWKTVEVGDVLAAGSILYTSYASEVTLEYANNTVLVVLALSEISIEKPVDYIKSAGRLKLGTGDVRFKVQQGDFRTDMKVSTPVSTGAVTGTDFAVSYNKETGVAIWEIYDQSISVTSNSTGATKTISSSYGAPIKRIEVDRDGVMTEQIAIPKDEWQKRQTEQPEGRRQGKSSSLMWILIILFLGAGVFILSKTGKLRLMLQKVLPQKGEHGTI